MKSLIQFAIVIIRRNAHALVDDVIDIAFREEDRTSVVTCDIP